MLRRRGVFVGMGLALVLLPAVAYALDGRVDGRPVPELQVTVDTIWTAFAAVLVFLMQAGFAMVEGGFTRAKNVANTMMKNFGDFSMAALGFWILGFGIMFGNGNAFFGTTGFFVAADTGDLYQALSWTSVPTLTAWFFQLMFCATAATIVAGAMAERTRFLSYLVFSFFISLFFYPVVGHWIWGGGWLAELGMLDFAGATVVHSTGAWFALAGVIVLGPRLGKYSDLGVPRALPGHNPDARYAGGVHPVVRLVRLQHRKHHGRQGSRHIHDRREHEPCGCRRRHRRHRCVVGCCSANPMSRWLSTAPLPVWWQSPPDAPGWSPGPRCSSSASFRVSSWYSPC